MRIGLLGGSFNPAHEGHRMISLFALRRLGLTQIWWLVSPQNPLKPSRGMSPLKARMEKAHLVANHPKIFVSDIEARLGTRFTVDTLIALKKHFPRAEFVWLMGADNMKQLPCWRDWQHIFDLAPVAVLRRPGYAAGRGLGKPAQRFRKAWVPAKRGKKLMEAKLPAWTVLDNPLSRASATEIRKQQKEK